jgi:hypothetical protein
MKLDAVLEADKTVFNGSAAQEIDMASLTSFLTPLLGSAQLNHSLSRRRCLCKACGLLPTSVDEIRQHDAWLSSSASVEAGHRDLVVESADADLLADGRASGYRLIKNASWGAAKAGLDATDQAFAGRDSSPRARILVLRSALEMTVKSSAPGMRSDGRMQQFIPSRSRWPPLVRGFPRPGGYRSSDRPTTTLNLTAISNLNTRNGEALAFGRFEPVVAEHFLAA